MEEFTDVNVMSDFFKGEDQPSAIEKLLNEFETHERKEISRTLSQRARP